VNGATEDFFMASKYKAEQVVGRLKKVVSEGGLIFIAAVGSGISAKFSERGGADIIATYSIAKYRMMGFSRVSYLPIGDANAMTEDLGKNEILPIVRETPVVAGVFAPNPTLDLSVLLDEYARLGFSGVMNCPTIALLDGWYRQSLEDMGLGFDKEVELTRLAVERDLFVQPFVTTPDEAERMVGAGAHMIIAHLGGTVPVDDQEEKKNQLDEAAEKCAPIFEAVKKMKEEVFAAVHGGPVAFPDDVRELKARVPALEGFLGGSSAERLPVEGPIRQAVAEFKSIKA
jgi:predicted TIM-barrel enzyme